MSQEYIYKILIFRADNNHIEAFESEDYKAVQTMYKGLDYEWVASSAEKRPFRMPEPALHSFTPSLITEIKVESMSKEEYLKQKNPYYQQMQKNGLGGAMNQNFNTGY